MTAYQVLHGGVYSGYSYLRTHAGTRRPNLCGTLYGFPACSRSSATAIVPRSSFCSHIARSAIIPTHNIQQYFGVGCCHAYAVLMSSTSALYCHTTRASLARGSNSIPVLKLGYWRAIGVTTAEIRELIFRASDHAPPVYKRAANSTHLFNITALVSTCA
ncbi:hypothetical protein BDD12DRAFT_458340 [Trichophaea hybrida]|nr:hypothetical protein BDD12DRAFT_458340 [Trichophaea hybrida]